MANKVWRSVWVGMLVGGLAFLIAGCADWFRPELEQVSSLSDLPPGAKIDRDKGLLFMGPANPSVQDSTLAPIPGIVVRLGQNRVPYKEPQFVTDVSPSRVMPFMIEAARYIKANRVQASGIDGDGVTVAMCDFFGDPRYHGEWVASIIQRIAPAAKIVRVNLSQYGETEAEFDAVVNCLKWVEMNRESENISVVNLSLGGSIARKGCTPERDPLINQAAIVEAIGVIKQLTSAGTFVVAATGNDANVIHQNIIFPACLDDVIDVGAVWDANLTGAAYHSHCRHAEINPTAGQVTCYSNLAQTVYAPGSEIRAPAHLTFFHGTSAATPMVSGALALVRQITLERGTKLDRQTLVRALADSGIPARVRLSQDTMQDATNSANRIVRVLDVEDLVNRLFPGSLSRTK